MVVKHPVDESTAQRFIDHDYHDRGMMKWQGFMLSDHSAYIKRAKQKAVIEQLPAQPLNHIQELIRTAVTKNKIVIIQPNYLNLDQPVELTGQIKGVQDAELYLKTKQRMEVIAIDTIRNLRFVNRN
ncbi:hypothetical protein ACYATP_07730 [Lactobacillaceae bacterium Melli_B4]